MAFNILNMKWQQHSDEDLGKDRILFGERKYIMKIRKK